VTGLDGAGSQPDTAVIPGAPLSELYLPATGSGADALGQSGPAAGAAGADSATAAPTGATTGTTSGAAATTVSGTTTAPETTVAATTAGVTGGLPLTPVVAAVPVTASGPALYVDCAVGQDTAAGNASHPWNSLRPLQAGIPAGATVYLRRGCTWNGPVVIASSGATQPSAASPILVTGFGIGAAPTVDGAGLGRDLGVVTVTSPFVTLAGLHVTGAAGPGFVLNGAHDSIVGSEIDRVAVGVRIMAPFGFVSSTAIHDLHMLVNTPGGDDDSGAIGFDIEADDATVWRSSCTHCRAASYDYGYDGGFADVFNSGSRLHLLENTANDVEGFLELGAARPTARADDVVVQGNTVTDTHGALWVHGSGTFTIGTARMLWNANTVRSTDSKALLGGDLRALTLTDNLFAAAGRVIESSAPAVHTGNRYLLTGGAVVGFALGAGETVATG
jgi:hypothetical protein